jgi:Bacteriophage related domain of unknown function
MSSPEVWQEARSLLENAGLGVPFAWPNEEFPDPADSADPIFVAVEIEGGLAMPAEIGPGPFWEESGRLTCWVMVPRGTGIDAGKGLQKAIANVFRFAVPGPVIWHEVDMGPGRTSDEGNYFAMSVEAGYRFTDRPV